MKRRTLAAVAGLACLAITTSAGAQQPPNSNLQEPVYRVANSPMEATTNTRPAHPLDVALGMANDGLVRIQRDIRDYTCVLVKRERVNGTLGEHEYMFCKIRNRKVVDGNVVTPFSVYMYFLKPTNIRGREVIFVEGQNNGKLCAHEGGTQGRFLPTVWLDPNHALAMRNQLYPITDLGIENLVLKLIERGEQERERGDCQVTFRREARLNGRLCTVLEIGHDVQRPEFEFSLAQVFIDDELGVPIRYVAFGWPENGSPAPVLEEYNYTRLEINVGLTDADFDPKNEQYGF